MSVPHGSGLVSSWPCAATNLTTGSGRAALGEDLPRGPLSKDVLKRFRSAPLQRLEPLTVRGVANECG